MAIEKDPSIYRDRGSIGSTEELDEYGVWVKSEPEDVNAADKSEEASIEPDLPDIEDLPDLSIDDADLASFEDIPDSPAESLPDLEGEAESAIPAESELGDEAFSELSVEDFLGDASDEEPAVEAEPVADEPLDIDLSFEEIPEEAGATEIDDFDLGSISDESESETEGADSGLDELEAEEVSDFDDFINELSENPAATTASAAPQIPEADESAEEPIEIDIQDDILEEPVAQEAGDTDFDDLDALGKSLMEESEEDVAVIPAPSGPEMESSRKVDLSTELLMRIAEELSSIKGELSSLKDELSSLKQEGRVAAEPKETEPEGVRGFFDEEEDEKIALTGDELDNILNTANFTEEAGSDAVGEEDESAFLSDRDDLIPAEEPEAVPSVGLDEVQDPDESLLSGDDMGVEIDEIPEEPDSPAVEEPIDAASAEEADALSQLRENGVPVMTSAPEDTSYLDEDLDVVDHEDIDLKGAVIEEPDLGGLTLEDTILEEPDLASIDIDLDLDLETPIEDNELEAVEEEDEESSIELPLHEESAEPEPELEELNVSDLVDDFEVATAPAEEDVEPLPEVEEISLDEAIVEPVTAAEPEPPLEEEPVVDESFAAVLPEDFVVEAEGSEDAPVAEVEELSEPEPLAEAPEYSAEEEPVVEEKLPDNIKNEVRSVLAYMDQLLESLPEEKIEEFARSEYFDTYKKLFEELGLA